MRAAGRALAMLCGLAAQAGCSGNDACKGYRDTCLSLTLLGEKGVARVDQLVVMLMRVPRAPSPMMRLSDPQQLPVKVAILWPDGAHTIGVRSYLEGKINGVTPELTLDLRGGAHARRVLALYPPLPGGDEIMDLGAADLRKPSDLAVPPDLSTPPDLAVPPDLSAPPDLGGDGPNPLEDAGGPT